jgi:hypothetical protein
MGMFDNLICEYQLKEEHQAFLFQTKDTPNQFLDHYRIDRHGQLWVQEYDLVDKSDPSAEGIERMFGCMSRVNERWKKITDYNGSIRFYTLEDEIWIEYLAYLENGVVFKLKHLIVL